MNKLSINLFGTEQEIIEGILNIVASGGEGIMTLGFLALAKEWHAEKLFYYRDLICEVENSR